MGGGHAVERSHRAAAEAARPARPHDRRAGRHHGQGGAAPQHHPAQHFAGDRGTGACVRRASARSAPPGHCADRIRSRAARLRHSRIRRLAPGREEIELLADPGAGEVRIGSTIYTGETFVTAVIERLSRRYPRILFHLVTSDETDTLYRELSERNVDFLIARKGGRLGDEKLGFEILYDPSLVVMAGSRSRWARRRRIALAELVNEA